MLSRSLRQFYARGLIAQPKLAPVQAFPTAYRMFSSNSAGESEDQADLSPEEVRREPVRAAPSKPMQSGPFAGANAAPVFDPIPKSLFVDFDLGNIKKVDSTPDH